jgi:exosortase
LSHAVQAAPLEFAPEPSSSERTPLWQLAVLTAALLWLYAPVLYRLIAQWVHDPNYSHGFFVPAFSLYVVWQERDRLRRLPRRPSWYGLLILAIAVVVLTAGTLGAELFLSRTSFLIAISGLVVLFFGWSFLRAILFPWLFLLLMIPIPNIIFNQITFPLQLLASKAAAFVLPLLGVPVLREGNVIQLPVMTLEVAEACSGIRSLMSLATLSIIYGYLLETRISTRVILAIAAIPIAVIANGLRIIGTGLLVQYWDPEKAEGFFHAFSGWLIFVVSLLLLFLLHKGLQKLQPREEQH